MVAACHLSAVQFINVACEQAIIGDSYARVMQQDGVQARLHLSHQAGRCMLSSHTP